MNAKNKIFKPKLIIFKTAANLADYAAKEMFDYLLGADDPVLCLATGGTPIPTYKKLSELCNANAEKIKHKLTKLKTFNLDEYWGLDEKFYGLSYVKYMEDNFYSWAKRLGFKKENAFIPELNAKDPDLACKKYEEELKKGPRIGMQVLGVGVGDSAHIGFNEKGSSFDSITRLVALAPSTRQANSRFFGGNLDNVPKFALTMGLKSIISNSDRILLLATGKGKAESIKQIMSGEVTEKIPASAIWLHPNVEVLIDKEAAMFI